MFQRPNKFPTKENCQVLQKSLFSCTHSAVRSVIVISDMVYIIHQLNLVLWTTSEKLQCPQTLLSLQLTESMSNHSTNDIWPMLLTGLSIGRCGVNKPFSSGQNSRGIGMIAILAILAQDCPQLDPKIFHTFIYLSNVSNPRALAEILGKAERDLVTRRHPDPYISEQLQACWTTSLTFYDAIKLLLTLVAPNGMYFFSTLNLR